MPPVVAAIGAITSFTVAGIQVGSILLSAVVGVGLSFASQALSKALAPKQRKASAAGSTKVTIRDPLAARRLVYGETRVAGTIVYTETTYNNEYLHLVIALCEGPVEAIPTIYFNDEELGTLSEGGLVLTGRYAENVLVEKFLGTSDQAASPTLLAFTEGGKWTSNHRLQGIAYLYVRLLWRQGVWPSGVPNITAVIKGRKVYDPRTETTVWTRNAALCLRDFLLLAPEQGGVGAVESEIDDVSFIAAANICDETVATPEGTEPRYTVSGVIDLDQGSTPQELVQSLLTSCGGRLSFWGGQWHLNVAAWRSPTFTLTDAMLRGPLTVETRVSRREQFNAVKGTFLSVADRWIAKDYPAITSAAFESEDGGTRIYRDLSFEWTDSPYAAQRLAKIELYRAREPITVKAQCKLHAYAVTVGDVIRVTHERWGWSNKTFDVAEAMFVIVDGALGIDLTLRETSAAVYDWSADEATLFEASPATTLPDWTDIGAPEVSLSSGDDELVIGNDGTVISRIRVDLVSTDARTDMWEVSWKLAADTAWTDPVSIGASGQNSWWISPIAAGSLYDVRARAVSVLGTRSPWTTVEDFLAEGKLEPPDDVVSVDLIGSTLIWSYPSPPADFAGFRVRYQSGAVPHWPSATAAHSGLLTVGTFETAAFLNGTVTFLVKAVDQSGNESENPGTVTTTLDGSTFQNVVYTDDLHAAGFPGTIDAGIIDVDDLVGDVTGAFWSANELDPFWNPAQTLFWYADTWGAIDWSTTFTPPGDALDATIYIDSTMTGANQAITYRAPSTALNWGANDAVIYWDGADGETYWEGPGPWVAWPGALTTLRSQEYELRVTISGGAEQPAITAFSLVYTVPDLSEALANIAISSSGSRLPVTKDYRAIEVVAVTVQGTAAVTARVEDKDTAGPLVRCFDGTGSPVNSVVDAIIQGY